MSMIKLGRLSFATLGLAVLLAGCGGPDNEKTGLTDESGKAIKVERAGGPSTASDYNATQKSEGGMDAYKQKGYPKK